MAGQHSAGNPGFPPMGSQPNYSFALHNLRQQIAKDGTTCWLLVGLVALYSWYFGFIISSSVSQVLRSLNSTAYFDPTPYFTSDPIATMFLSGEVLEIIVGLGIGVIFPAAVIYWAISIFRSVKKRVVKDLALGNMALMLVDEQYGFQIQEAVAGKYRLVLGKVLLSGDLTGKVNHFAYYYKYYYQMSFGPSDLRVASVSAESCWLEGCAMVMCNSCPLIFIALGLRIILVRPRVIGIKTAVLEYLEGRHDNLLEQPTSKFVQ